MPVPWLRILDALIGITDLARSRRIRTLSQAAPDQSQALEALDRDGGGLKGGFERRLAGVVVAALKETFDRDSRRLELEREQIAAERERLERTLKLELLRQAGEREIGRLRLLAGVAIAAWIATLIVSARLMGGPVGPRVALGAGWALLLSAVASAFVAQSQIAGALDLIDAAADPRDVTSPGLAGALALWMIVLGLAVVGLAILL